MKGIGKPEEYKEAGQLKSYRLLYLSLNLNKIFFWDKARDYKRYTAYTPDAWPVV